MAKINIKFNNADYSIDESALTSATNDLKSHLSTAMSGSGATITLGGTTYNIDSTKLSNATTEFVAHLGTIAGSGAKVVVNGTEYGIDSTKLTTAISDIEAVLAGTGEERLEGDGAEYYTLAPTALSFRSTAPLNELQEVQINGVTVDSSNYTLEEGSTIVTFPIEYLKTLNVGNYEVDVVSDSKTVKGDFSVKAPELNEHGFYYNQPYTAFVEYFDTTTAFFVREDGTLDAIIDDITEVCSYVVDGNSMTITTSAMGDLHCTISSDGTEIYNMELATAFVLGNESIVADDDYIYIYREELGGYKVAAINKTKASYGDIKTGINGIDTVGLVDRMFENNIKLVTAPKIPDSVIRISDYAFNGCINLTNLTIPYGVEHIGCCAFSNTNLTDIYIPDSVIGTDDGVFQNCRKLVSVTIPDHWTYINSNLFSGCSSLKKIIIPSSATSIKFKAFSGCTNLTEIVIPNSVVSIEAGAFNSCNNLKKITLPFIGEYDGANNTGYFGYIFGAESYSANRNNVPQSLKEVVITIGTHIEMGAFSGCNSLEKITIPASVTSIGEYVFEGCDGLIDVTIDENNAVYYSSGNCIITKATKSLCYGFNNSIIPNNIINIGDRAFYCTSLESITIPDSVTSIGHYAFYNCDNLTSVVIPDSVTSIGWFAFSGCTSLTSITIPDSITSIDDQVFLDCTRLTSIAIPNSVTSIGNRTFYNCSNLADITFNGTTAQWNAITKDIEWNNYVPATYVQCSDGQVAL